MRGPEAGAFSPYSRKSEWVTVPGVFLAPRGLLGTG